MSNIAIATQSFVRLASGRVESVGLELEGFSEDLTSEGLASVKGGYCTDDAGLNLCELITDPVDSTIEALNILKSLVTEIGGSLYLQSTRPSHLMKNSGVWHERDRYKALLKAAAYEACQHGGDPWLINSMTDWAALQVNVSGNFDPFGTDGVFLIDLFNNIAPAIAYVVHKEVGQGYGHLEGWQRFAHPRRFPVHNRWFGNSVPMIKYIESTPRLFRKEGETYITNPEGEKQSVEVPADLGVMWWFLRPKLSPTGDTYLEARFLPSMPLAQTEKYTQLSVSIMEAALDWFHVENQGKAVSTKAQAKPAIKYLNQKFSCYIPKVMLTEADWDKFRSM